MRSLGAEGPIQELTDELRDETVALGLILELSNRLSSEGVSYCHFKSNEGLDRSLSGENDLDLLIARDDAQRFQAVLADLGFRVARPASDRQVPGVLDYYGLDPESERIVHVHAHHQLFVGDDTTKNYRLDIEDAYLDSVDPSDVLPTPDPSFEFVLFVLRMVMKHFPFDAQLARKGKLTRTERRELDYLVLRIDEERVHRIVEEHLPEVDKELFDAAIRAVKSEINRLQRAFVARRLVRSLKDRGRRPPASDVLMKVWRRLKWRSISRFRGRRGKRLERGGMFIAVVGGDGSGKSTAVATLGDFLARHLDTKVIHLGKPPRSGLTRLVKWPMARLRNRGMLASTRLGPTDDVSSAPFPGYGYLVWHLLTARDRYQAYVNARRLVASGSLVVSDRLPLPSIRFMDAPRTDSLNGAGQRPLARWLVSKEARYYERIDDPDLLIVLRVDPELAVERRGDQDPDFVRTRAEEVWTADWDLPNCVVIDASRPLEEVQTAVRRAVWERL